MNGTTKKGGTYLKNKSDEKPSEKQLIKLRDYKVVKANNLIQKSRFELSLQEQKIVLYLISKIKPDDEEFKEHTFKIQDFCKVCGIDYDNGKNYKNIKDTIKKLADKSLWVKVGNKEILLRWINEAEINDLSGTIMLKIHEKMKPYLLQLQKHFTEYELLYTLAMKSQYSIRIYELLKSYGNLYIVTFDIEGLKRMLSAENYKLYGDFKRKVLDISLQEINELSDIKVTYETIKEGRKFIKLKFLISLKKDFSERIQTWQRINEIISPPKDFEDLERHLLGRDNEAAATREEKEEEECMN